MMIVHVACGWTTTTTTGPTGMQVPDALKSGDAAVFTPVKPSGPSPVLVIVIGADCAIIPIGTGVGKFTDGAAGVGVPGGAAMDCTKYTLGCVERFTPLPASRKSVS